MSTPKGMQLVELLGPYVTEAVRKSAKRGGRGWTRCTLPIETIRQAVRELMRLGDDVEVLGPTALRQCIAEVSTAIARRHSGVKHAR